MPQSDLVQLPGAAAIMSQVGSSSAPVFNELISPALFLTGLVVGGMIVYAVMHWFINGIGAVVGQKTGHEDTPGAW
jgi:hypothetical protein